MKKWGEEDEEPKPKPKPKKHQKFGQKLAGKRGGQLTPVLLLPFPAHTSNRGVQDSNPVSKLAATVWEIHQYNLPLAKMHRHHHHHHQHHLLEDNPHLGNAGSLRRHVAASLMQHHEHIQRTHNTARAVSPTSYGSSSSMEVAHYNHTVTPTRSMEFRGGNGETSYTLKTSTELLKVLNRIWSLEEQQAANITLVKDLKRELDLARSKIKELARDRRSDRHEMEHLMKQITQDKQGHATSTVQSARDELEGERKLRKQSETLHRKLARELYETKMSLASALKDLEKEKKSRVLLEDLCDEFAWGVKNYEQELHSLRHINQDRGKGANFTSTRDGMILHISESWLDQRMQMKQETAFTKKSAIEQLSLEIESFIEAKQKGVQKLGPGSGPVVGPTGRRRHSLESIPMNLASNAPPDNEDVDDDSGSSDGGDSPCFELDNHVARGKGNNVNSHCLQVKFEERMAQAILDQEQEKNIQVTEDEVGLNSIYLDNLLKNHYLLTGNEPDDAANNKPVWKGHPSPVRGWTTTLPTEDLEVSESSSKVKTESKEQTTLKTKLLEARTRGHRPGSRAKK